MRIFLLAAVLSAFAAPSVFAQTCAGPGPCTNPAPTPSAPAALCLSAALGCAPVIYQRLDWPAAAAGHDAASWFVAAFSTVRGYPVAAIAGPCLPGWECPALAAEAFERLRVDSLVGQRAVRWEREH